MNVTITPKPLEGTLSVISSKSMSHRYLIAAGLADGTSIISNVLDSDDIEATKEALKAFGVICEDDHIHGGKRTITSSSVNVKESGSTLRFMIPIYLLDQQGITIHGEGRLIKRPLDDYERLFQSKGVTFKRLQNDSLPLYLKGRIKGGHYPIRGDVSSQFISGLLFALPLRREDSVIELLTPLESKGYVDLTLSVLKTFGIHVLKVDQYFYIKGSQRYIPHDVTVEGDYSQAAFFIVAGLLGKQPIILKNLHKESLQGDKAMIDIVKQMDGNITWNDDQLIVYPSTTKGSHIDLKDIPDLGPILMVLAARSEGVTVFEHCERLRIKESDRLQAMVDILTTLGVKIEVNDDQAIITGTNRFKGNQTFDSYHDHRIVMALSIAAILADGPIMIRDAEAINKSYKTFFEDYQKLGGDVK